MARGVVWPPVSLGNRRHCHAYGSAVEAAAGGTPFIRIGSGVIVEDTEINFAQGPLKNTGNPLDLALAGDGFFAIRTPDGDRYTRCGAFTRDAEGHLVTFNGFRVLGANGPIQLEGGMASIDAGGNILVGDEAVDQLQIVTFDSLGQLQRVGHGLFVAPESAEPQAVEGTEVRQGYLELSNGELSTGLIELMMALRAYQAGQRLFQLQDGTLERLVNEIGRVA